MRKYIIFKAEGEDPQWKERKLNHSQSLTWIIKEHWDSSDKGLPEPGYRPDENIRIDSLHDPRQHAYSTHYRKGDWEVVRVETYTPDLPISEFDMIVICYCHYNPINADLHPRPPRQVSIGSFGGDEAAYQRWLETQKQTAEVVHG